MKTAPPPWASFFSASAYRHFMRCVEERLRARAMEYELQDGSVLLREQGIVVGLVNLAQRCSACFPPQWPALVDYVLDQVVAAQNQDAVIRELVADPARGRERLRVQLQSDEYLRGLRREDFVVAPILPWLWKCVVWDLPTTVAIVSRADVAIWKLADDDLFAIGLANVRAHEPAPRTALDAPPGLLADELAGSSHFVATHALLLEDPSAVVFIPNRHTVLVGRLSAGEDPQPIVDWLGPIAARAFRDGPGSIAPAPLLLRDGHLGDLRPTSAAPGNG